MRTHAWFVLVATLVAGCYHASTEPRRPAPAEVPATHLQHRPTWLDGFVGTGTTNTLELCAHPVRTELRVGASDVTISILKLLIDAPHTLYVTCGNEPAE